MMTYAESMEAYKAIKAQKNPYFSLSATSDDEREENFRKQMEWRKNHETQLDEALSAIVPEAGVGCTIIFFSDRDAATVTRVISPKTIAVRMNDTECLDYFAGEYKVLPELRGEEMIFTKRKNGVWCKKGQPMKGSVKLALHYQETYIDPNF